MYIVPKEPGRIVIILLWIYKTRLSLFSLYYPFINPIQISYKRILRNRGTVLLFHTYINGSASSQKHSQSDLDDCWEKKKAVEQRLIQDYVKNGQTFTFPHKILLSESKAPLRFYYHIFCPTSMNFK
jgi:hypothetical protein